MRKWIFIVGMLIGSSFCGAQTAPGRLVVHEWGTFTNFAGADGVYLEYRPLVGSDLPAFVFDQRKQAALNRKLFLSGLTKVGMMTRSRMETPVTYFYTDAPMAIQAHVDFPHGLLTEFYPPVRAMGPEVKEGEAKPAIRDGYLDWGQFTVFPPGQLEESRRRIPAVGAGDPYAAARDTDSDIVWSSNVTGNYMEKFLFYRGVGNFEPPVTMASAGKDRFVVRNGGREAIRAAFLVQIREGRIRFSRAEGIGRSATIELSREVRSLEALGDAMAKDLAAAGLYEKEARAMVNTWKGSWFGEEGTRLLYLLPQAFTDAELPLTIAPKPSQCVRVMVGRLEALTPEMEDRISSLVRQLGAEDCAAREEAERQLRGMGRFAEPALQRVGQNLDDQEMRMNAELMLAALRAE